MPLAVVARLRNDGLHLDSTAVHTHCCMGSAFLVLPHYQPPFIRRGWQQRIPPRTRGPDFFGSVPPFTVCGTLAQRVFCTDWTRTRSTATVCWFVAVGCLYRHDTTAPARLFGCVKPF